MKNLSGLLAVLAMFLCATISYGQTFPIRIDCGSLVDTNENGTIWLADQYYQNAENKYSGHGNLTLGEPYESVRYSKLPTGLPTFSYSIPVPDGNYELTLHFVEAYFGISGSGGNGSRIFNVNIEGVQHAELTNLDIHAEVGPNAIFTRTYSVLVNDGNLTIDFASVNGADAIISAIEVDQIINTDDQAPNIPTGLTVTSFDHESASLTWNAPVDNGGGTVAGYYIYNNGIQIASSTGTSTTLTGLLEQTPHQLSIAAYDDATNSNVSSQSTPTVNFTTSASGGGSSQYNPNLELRINAGGPAGTYDNNSYLVDSSYTTGGGPFQNTNTGLNEPYVSERYNTSRTMSYDIPLENGEYKVILHFAELWYGAAGGGVNDGGPGKRVFDVNIEGGALELDNYDINAEVGPQTLDSKEFIVNVDGSELNIYFSSLAADGGVGHPKVNAIEILGSNLYNQDPPQTGGGQWAKNDATNNIYYTNGNVGIGTTNIDGWELAVGGEIRAEEIKVETGWADYVFFDDYKLPTLHEVEQHIQEKGHLINIPSAEEVEANGIKLGEMNKLLLEKIEELTLYTIQQQKEIEELKQILKAQK